MSQDENIAVASELQEVEQLLKFLTALKPDNPQYQELLVAAFDKMATVTNKCLDAKKLFDAQNDEARNLADEVASLEKKVDSVRKGAKTVVKDRNKALYNAYLKTFMGQFSTLLAEFDGKFTDSVDARAQANYEGVGLIYNNFENTMVFNGLHVKEEPKAEEAQTQENQAEEAQVEVKAEEVKTEEKTEATKASTAEDSEAEPQAQERAPEASPETQEEGSVKTNTESKESK